jgi:hypothetical protein
VLGEQSRLFPGYDAYNYLRIWRSVKLGRGFRPYFGPSLFGGDSGKVPNDINQRLSGGYDNLGVRLQGFCDGLKLLEQLGIAYKDS